MVLGFLNLKLSNNNLETHLYALTSPKIGTSAHQRARGFASVIGMRVSTPPGTVLTTFEPTARTLGADRWCGLD
jgi:hypothetical protein